MDSFFPVLVSGVVAIIVTGLGIWFGRRKNRADIAATYVDAAAKLVEPLTTRIDEQDEHIASLEAEVAEVRDENRKLRRHNQILFAEVIENGGVPTSYAAMGFMEGD